MRYLRMVAQHLCAAFCQIFCFKATPQAITHGDLRFQILYIRIKILKTNGTGADEAGLNLPLSIVGPAYKEGTACLLFSIMDQGSVIQMNT